MQQANGTTNGSREMIDSVKQLVGQLEAELRRQQEEIAQLRAERTELRRLLIAQHNSQLLDENDWENIDEKEFSLTIEDLLAVVRSK